MSAENKRVCGQGKAWRALLSGAIMSAPARRRRLITSMCDSYAATCSGVRPSWSRTVTSARAPSKRPVTSPWPQNAAQCRGATPIASWQSALIPPSNSALTASALPCIAAMVNASAMPSGSAEEDGAFVFGSSRALERQVLGPLEEGIVGVLVVVEWAVERSLHLSNVESTR